VLYEYDDSREWRVHDKECLGRLNYVVILSLVQFGRHKSSQNQKQYLGLIAQDVKKVFPQVIDTNKLPSKPDQEQEDDTEYLGVRYQEMIPVLVKAIQELNEKIQQLENKLTANGIN
jgi:formiminotetrahydrofolate cyclodeaminase